MSIETTEPTQAEATDAMKQYGKFVEGEGYDLDVEQQAFGMAAFIAGARWAMQGFHKSMDDEASDMNSDELRGDCDDCCSEVRWKAADEFVCLFLEIDRLTIAVRAADKAFVARNVGLDTDEHWKALGAALDVLIDASVLPKVKGAA